MRVSLMTMMSVAALSLALGQSGCGKKDEATGEAPKTTAGTTPETPAADPPKPAEPAAPATYCGADPCPCEAGSEEKHYETELMRKCKLTKAMDVQGYPVKEGGEVTFDKDGKLMAFYLGKDFEVLGYQGTDKTGVGFFPDGTLKEIYIKEKRDIDGVPCINGVGFYKTGKLRRCEVGAEAELSGHKAQPGDWVTLDENGKLHRWEVGDRTQAIGTYECSGYMNYVHPTGELLRCGFAKETKVEGKKYKPGDLLCFDTAGKVADCATFTFDVGGD
ncbi:MAG TPA: hypothetical protein VML75_15630 [Kofleriaceae bacterium]|nr:hypothetical protein [Kofleriaceae bacterium]